MLQLTDLDLKAGRITINRVKGSMSGTYPMSPDTMKLLKSYIKSRKDASAPPPAYPKRSNNSTPSNIPSAPTYWTPVKTSTLPRTG